MAKVEIHYTPNFIVLVDNLPHIAIQGELQGFQSYIDVYKPKGAFFIEYFTEVGGIISQYEERELWEQILNNLKHKFYGKVD